MKQLRDKAVHKDRVRQMKQFDKDAGEELGRGFAFTERPFITDEQEILLRNAVGDEDDSSDEEYIGQRIDREGNLLVKPSFVETDRDTCFSY